MREIRRIWFCSGKYRKLLVFLFLCTCAGALFQIMIPLVMSDMLDNGIGNQDLQLIWRDSLQIVILTVLLILKGLSEGYLISRWSSGVVKNLSEALFKKMLVMDSGTMNRFGIATVLTRLTTDIEIVRRALQMVSSLLLAPVLIIFTIISAFRIDRQLAMIFLLAAPVFTLIMAVIIRLSRKHYRTMLLQYDRINEILGESLEGIRTVKTFHMESRQAEHFEDHTRILRQSTAAAERIASMNNPVTQMTVNICILALVWFGRLRILSGGLMPGGLLCLISYANQILNQMMIMSLIIVPMINSHVSLNRIWEVIDARIPEQGNRGEKPDSGSVVFDHVSFSYQENRAGNALLNDLCFSIEPGEFIGIIGPSASGKSTLLKLMMGLYRPDQGRIKIGGADTGSISREDLVRTFAYVPQKCQLFTGTVAENVLFGCETADEEDVKRACRLACADEFVEKLPDKYQTIVAEGGRNLSVGQKQRLCLARALISSAPVLVLDNTTSALDRITTAEVCRNLRESGKNRTRIMVSDNIDAIRDADRIIVMDRGQITGIGNHKTLLESCVVYREIVESQEKSLADG